MVQLLEDVVVRLSNKGGSIDERVHMVANDAITS